MITIGGKEITAAYVGKRALLAVYTGQDWCGLR